MKKLLIAAVAAVIVVTFAADAFAQTRTHTCTTIRVGNVIQATCRTIVPATAQAATRQATAMVRSRGYLAGSKAEK